MVDQNINCNPPILDTTLFPVGTAVLDPNYDVLPFLCQLMKIAATNDNIDPVLAPPVDYDLSPHVNFTTLTGVGDPRFSTGSLLSAGFIKFLPRIISQIEVKEAGGSQIINDFICDADGTPIKRSQTIPAMTSIGSGGVNVLGYDIPSGLDTNELLKPLSQDEVTKFINTFINEQVNNNADCFIAYLQENYPSDAWTYQLNYFKFPPFFYVLVTSKANGSYVYLKYHDDAKDHLASQMYSLGMISSASINTRLNSVLDDRAMINAFMQPIPDYCKILNDQLSKTELLNNSKTLFTSDPSLSFSKMNAALANGSISKEAFNLIAFANSPK